MIKVKSWLFIIQTVLIIISIPPSYATTSIEDGIEYASTILKSRLQYFNSLKNFVSNPENTFSDKMTLIGSVTSENYYQKLKKALDPLPEELRDQEFQKIIKNFIDDIENSSLSVYSTLVEIFSFELDFIKGTQELISAKNLVTDGTKILRERYSELNWEGIDKRAKLIACYSYLVVIHEFFCLQRVFRDLEPILLLDFEFEVTEVKAEFYRTELKIIEDLKNYLLTLMSKKDREFVEHFEVVRKLDKSTGIRSFGVSDKNSLLEKYKSYWNSYKKLGYEFQILNYEFFRINKKINKKLSVREVSKSLTSVPELIDLSETPVEEPSEIMNYFLTSTTPNLVSKLEYLRSNIVLNPLSQQKLVELLQAIPSRESSVRVALTCNYDFKNNPLFKEIYDYFDQLKSLFENDPSHTNITRRRLFGETAFLESYVTNIHSFLLNEAAQFNTELAQEISSFTELLKSFDENGIRGTKQQFKVIKKVSPSPVPSSDSHSEMNLSTSTLQVDTILASQSSVLKDRLIVEGSKEGLLEQESHQQLPPLELKSEGSEDLEEKETQSAIESPVSMRSFDEQNLKIYSRYLRETRELTSYREKLNRDITGRHLNLLEKLYSQSTGEIRFDDLKSLVRRCGGVLEFSRGSHFRITMPEGKIAFGFRPHGSEHSSKLRNLALESFRIALADVREAVLSR